MEEDKTILQLSCFVGHPEYIQDVPHHNSFKLRFSGLIRFKQNESFWKLYKANKINLLFRKCQVLRVLVRILALKLGNSSYDMGRSEQQIYNFRILKILKMQISTVKKNIKIFSYFQDKSQLISQSLLFNPGGENKLTFQQSINHLEINIKQI